MEEPKSELLKLRRKKLDDLREQGINPFPNDFKPLHTTADVKADWDDKDAEAMAEVEDVYRLAGRIVATRLFGKAAFVVIKDRKGKLQLFVQKNKIGDDAFKLFKTFDIGDIVGVVGTPFRTKTDELTIKCDEIRLVTKSLHPLPEKFHGLTDTETRFRQRYLDLIVNPEVADIFHKRNKTVRLIRQYLDEADFMEVETPMMHPIAGGAAARPFVTHHNALDMDLYLRIAPELYLKRLLVGDLERVYEINRNFRNEGISLRHNPEFTMLEYYWAYATYEDQMDFLEKMLAFVAEGVTGSMKIAYQGQEIDFTPPFKRVRVHEGVSKACGVPEESLWERATLERLAKEYKIPDVEKYSDGKLLCELFDETVESTLIDPTFVTDYPLDVSPLARKKEADPRLVDRFELVVSGRELSNAFSELNDPDDQRARFESQIAQKEAGDDEAHEMDADYVHALEYGMPPAAGCGVGIDRLVMLLADQPSIRDVILFPQLRKQS